MAPTPTDNSTNGVRSTVSQEAVQEFQIITNSYAANMAAPPVAWSTYHPLPERNDFHGDVYGIPAQIAISRHVNPLRILPHSALFQPGLHARAGVALLSADPSRRNKTYYYFSYELTRRHETGFSPASVMATAPTYGSFSPLTPPASSIPLAPPGTFTINVTPQQAAFLANAGLPNSPSAQQYAFLAGGHRASL